MTEEVTSRARHLDLDIYTYLPCDLQYSLHFPLVVMGQICNTLCTLVVVVVVVCRNHQLILAPAAGGDWRRLFTHTRHWLHVGASSFGRIHAQTLTVILSQYIGFIISTCTNNCNLSFLGGNSLYVISTWWVTNADRMTWMI